jgi:hypothetical protein
MILDFSELIVGSQQQLSDAVTELLARAVGYFVIESTIFKSEPNLMSRAQVRKLCIDFTSRNHRYSDLTM